LLGGYSIEEEEVYLAVEAPKGEFGVYLRSDNTIGRTVVVLRRLVFCILASLVFYVQRTFNCGYGYDYWTQDIVFGEVDR
jgi:NADH-quinone oxidoreductase subunit D